MHIESAENAGRAFALVLVDELVRHGMQHAVVAPGSRSTPIALALIEDPRVTVHVRIDERSAAYLALGIAKASGCLVPVLCTSGTAASYFHGAVMEADMSRIPLLVLTADRPPELHGIGANQTVEQQGMYGDAVRWAPTVSVPESRPDSVTGWRSMLAEAVNHCQGRLDGPPGPVHLNLPLRDPLLPTDDGVGFPYPLDDHIDSPELDRPPTDLEPLIRRVRSARRGVVVAGGWTVGPDPRPVRDFAERAGWPIIAEPHSNVRHGGNALRTTDALLRDEAFVAGHRPDLVVVVGRVGLSRALLGWLADVPHIVVSPDGGNWNVAGSAEFVIRCGVQMLGDVHLPSSDPDWLADWLAASRRASDAIDSVLNESSSLTEPQVARDVAALVPDGGVLVVASSMPIRDLDLVMRPRSGVRIFANRGVSGIDGFVSTAQGIAIGYPSSGPTVALCGDLSLLHDVNGLLPGPDARPDVTYVVINNDGGGIFSLLPQGSAVDSEAFERLFGTPHGMSLRQVAVAYDVDYTEVRTAAELTTALSSYGGVRIIEVRTNRADNAALHERVRAITPRTA